mgnify:CR=1 FL=1
MKQCKVKILSYNKKITSTRLLDEAIHNRMSGCLEGFAQDLILP